MACGSCGKRIVSTTATVTANKRKVVTVSSPQVLTVKPGDMPAPVYYRRKR